MPRSFGPCWAIGNRNQALLGYQCLHRGSVLSNRHGPDRYAIMPSKCAAPPALQTFGVNSVDYLLKPVEAQQLDRALQKIDRIRNGAEPRPEIWLLLAQLQTANHSRTSEFPDGIASRAEIAVARDRTRFSNSSQVSFVRQILRP